MADSKEEGLWDAQYRKLGGEHGNGAGQARDGENDEQCADMERRIVLVGAGDVAGAGILAFCEAPEGCFGWCVVSMQG